MQAEGYNCIAQAARIAVKKHKVIDGINSYNLKNSHD